MSSVWGAMVVSADGSPRGCHICTISTACFVVVMVDLSGAAMCRKGWFNIVSAALRVHPRSQPELHAVWPGPLCAMSTAWRIQSARVQRYLYEPYQSSFLVLLKEVLEKFLWISQPTKTGQHKGNNSLAVVHRKHSRSTHSTAVPRIQDASVVKRAGDAHSPHSHTNVEILTW